MHRQTIASPSICSLLCLAVALVWAEFTVGTAVGASPYARWTNGPPQDPAFFPLAVWLQNPSNAPRYRQAGINTYVGLWRGPTEAQLSALKQAGMRVICSQNQAGLQHRDEATIIGWMHGDEPDNAQPKPGGGYGPPIEPAKIVRDYERIQAADPSRPVWLNLGQGVAYDQYIGRGVRRNHPEDYPEYIKGCDVVSFDIYPAVHDKPEIAGNLWYVAHGVQRLVKWSGGRKVVWNCIECTRIHNPRKKATPKQVRAEVWMSLIHGSQGIIYFVHEWEPKFDEAALLHDPEMLAAVTAINEQITRLAPVLNQPGIPDAVEVVSSNDAVPVALMTKHHRGAHYIFAVAMRNPDQIGTTASFHLRAPVKAALVEVLDENRTLQVKANRFEDTFSPWQVHLYRLTDKPQM